LTFLTTNGKLTDDRYSKLWERINKRGKAVIITLIIMLFLLTAQEFNNQNISDNNTFSIKKERRKQDSIITTGIKLGVESNSKKLYQDLSTAFAKEGLKIDTLKKTITKLESLKPTVNNYSQNDPVLRINKEGVSLKEKKNNIDKYGLKITSSDAGSTNHKILCYLLSEFADKTYDLSKINLFPENLKIPKNGNWETSFNDNIKADGENIYIYLKGTYTTLDGTKKYNIDDLYCYNKLDKTCMTLLNSKRNQILKIIQRVPENVLKTSEGN
jgi:hypothetical protein